MKQNKNNLVLVVVLFLLIIGLGSYVAYVKWFNINDTSLYNYNLSKRTTVQAVRNGDIEILVDTDGNAYLYTIGNLSSETDAQLKTNLENIEKQFQTYSPKGYTYIDGGTELRAYKLSMDGVLTSYYVHMGNGGFSYFVFIKENGKLSYLSYDTLITDGEISLKDIDNLENVVSIVENTYSMTPYAIDSNGNEISLYDYIK